MYKTSAEDVISIPVTFVITSISQLALNPPSSVITVIFALPFFFAVTIPSLTDAIFSLSETQLTFLFVVSSGVKIGVSSKVSPACKYF